MSRRNRAGQPVEDLWPNNEQQRGRRAGNFIWEVLSVFTSHTKGLRGSGNGLETLVYAARFAQRYSFASPGAVGVPAIASPM